FCGPAGQLFESKLSGLFDHSTFRTTQYVKGTVSTPGQVIGATDDFVRNYRVMREANTIGADKYYHCKANCEAAQCGEAGEETATFLSALRELVDRFIKRDPAEASEADQQANRHGRENADTGECGDVCETFKPDTLDPERTNEDPLKEDERQ